MPLNPISTESSPLRSSKSRSILSRLVSPLSSRTRNLSEFYIKPDEPHRQYTPGDVVKGAVVLTVVKPVRVTHLVVRLHGHVRVFKNANASGDDVYHDSGFLTAGRSKRGTESLGNGYATLFDDEITLCGEGRLDVGRYEFNFELDFPAKGVPSSIDFERGTISYMITSTITRPTAITPTSSCDRKIYLIETVDVAPFSQPKQRVISLKPISKSKKVKPSAKVLTPPSTRLSLSRTASSSHSGTADNRSSTEAPIPDQSLHSPTVSEMGARSVISSARSSRPEPVLASVKDSDAQSSETSIADRTITATIELQRAGCLPGDLLPIKISINHTKPIKSLEGVVVTLYRQGRVDTHPPIPIGSTGKGKSDEYYPKSRTGLGGLSFSSAGSSGVFRKDLAQTFAPLIVDPYTLTAVVKPSVRVPEDAFPTISSVPGAMISFKYYVEVIVDLRGKLAAERDSILPRLGITSAPSGSASSSHVLRRDENGAREVVSTIGGSLLDTDQIRREKSVVACLFEVIVGTRDSRRKRIQRVDWPQQPDYEGFTPAPSNDVRLPDNGEDYYFRESYDGPQNLGPSIGSGQPSQQYIPQHDPPPHMEAVPPPILEDEENLDEKTRMQRAEQRLLPSQPPIEDDGSPASAGHHPSAPEPIGDLNMDNSIYREGYGGPGTATYTHGGLSTPATNNTPFGNSQDQYGNSSDNGLAPDLGTPRPTDDKQELERRRLQVEASAPEDFPDDEETGLQGASANRASFTGFEPSAPVLPEEEYTPHSMDRLRHEAHYEQHSLTSESLPRYER